MLSFGDLAHGRLDIELRPMHVNTVIEEAISLCFRPRVHDHLEVVHHVHPGVPQLVMADVARVRQILANLLGK